MKFATKPNINREIFENLFVLEIANNHWGDVERGLRIISDFGKVIRFNNVRATMKLQFRDVERFIHKDWRERKDVRYIGKTLDTRMTADDQRRLLEAVRATGCLTSVTPFDEASVALCEELDVDILKIASSDINDWFLIERIAATRKPVIFSTGGSSLKDIDDAVTFFEHRNIPLAINHCVSLYPTEDWELELNQIDFLRDRYPGHVIGFSTHEYRDWRDSMLIAYSKGARTFERHVDVDADDVPVSPYCSTPEQCNEWFHAFHRVVEMCGGSARERRTIPEKETEYLDALVRGVYARRPLKPGETLTDADVYLAIPLQKGQVSCREFVAGAVMTAECRPDEPLRIEMIDTPYGRNPRLRELIEKRGIAPEAERRSGARLEVVDDVTDEAAG
jgi:N-acetylneuraminate synthase